MRDVCMYIYVYSRVSGQRKYEGERKREERGRYRESERGTDGWNESEMYYIAGARRWRE